MVRGRCCDFGADRWMVVEGAGGMMVEGGTCLWREGWCSCRRVVRWRGGRCSRGASGVEGRG